MLSLVVTLGGLGEKLPTTTLPGFQHGRDSIQIPCLGRMRILIDVVALLPSHLQTTDFQLISFNRCFIRTSPTLFGNAQGSHKYDRIAADRECERKGNACLDIPGKPKRPIVAIMPRELVYSFREYTLTLNPVLVCEVEGSPQMSYGCGSYFLRSRRQGLVLLPIAGDEVN